jgi:hypothetical protein
MAAGWYCKIADQLMGPMPSEQLVELARGGTLKPVDMVRRKTGEWVPAHDVRGLFPAQNGPDVPVAERETAEQATTQQAANPPQAG